MHVIISAENRNSLYIQGENKYVFNDIESVLSQIDRTPSGLLTTGAFGNHEEILDKLDLYRDESRRG